MTRTRHNSVTRELRAITATDDSALLESFWDRAERLAQEHERELEVQADLDYLWDQQFYS